MINVVLEGPSGSGKSTLIKMLYEHYSSKYKVGFTSDIDKTSPLYPIINKMFESTPLVTSSESFNTLRYETLVQASDYLYLREKLYSANNDINLFDRNLSSIYSYQSVLLENQIENDKEFMNNVLKCMKNGEKNPDLMVYFDCNVSTCLKRSGKRDNREYSKDEVKTMEKFNKKLKDFIRYHNSDYKLLVIENKDTLSDAFTKVCNKIDEILIDSKMSEDTKWYELYKIDVEEFPKPDDYITYKLKYKSKFIKTIKKYANNNKVIELGCGTGLVAGYLEKCGLDVTALDLSAAVLDYAEYLAKNSKVIAPCIYEVGNILDLKYPSNSFDVSYSNGVLEHFNDADIIKILQEQLRISEVVIFGVPSTYFNMNEKMLGNERSLTIKEWTNLINKAGGKLIKQTGFQYYKLGRRIIEIKKWFKPKAFWLFVITK